MNVGSIYLHEEFKFEDGSRGRKLFVVVNSPKKTENYLVCKTTSQESPPYRVKKQGCSAPQRNYFMFFAKDDWFEKDTWIQFDELYEFEITKLLQDAFGGKAKYMAELNPNNTRAILNCILKSEDISQIHLSSIKSTLKVLRKDCKPI